MCTAQTPEPGQIIVTGASRGIGSAVTRELARRGYEVVGLSRTGNAPAGRGIACDVSDEQALCGAIAEIAATGPIGGLVNNAGIHLSSPSAELSVEEYEHLMRVNATSAMIASREVHPHLKAAGGGLVVYIGSFFDKLGAPAQLAYSVSKAALGAMTRVQAVEWARDGITVVNVAPGYVETEFSDMWQDEKARKWLQRRIPSGQHGTPEEVGRFVGVLYDERIGFLTGETIYLDGAHSLNH